MSTKSYFQRLSARTVRSRNFGVISFGLNGWNNPRRRGSTRSKRRITPDPPTRTPAEIVEFQLQAGQQGIVRWQTSALNASGFTPSAAPFSLPFVDTSL